MCSMTILRSHFGYSLSRCKMYKFLSHVSGDKGIKQLQARSYQRCLEYRRDANLRIRSFSFKTIIPDIVKTIITRLENSSSSGIPDISIVIIKHCVDSLAPILACLINLFNKVRFLMIFNLNSYCSFQKRESLKL